MSRNPLMIVLPLGVAVTALGGIAVFTALPSPPKELAAPVLKAEAVPAPTPAAAVAVAAPAEVAPAVVAKRGVQARSAPAPRKRPKPLKLRFSERFSATARGEYQDEGGRGEGTGFDEWFYRQRAFPAGSIPADALGKSLRQAERLNGGLREVGEAAGGGLPTWTAIGPSTIPDGQTDNTAGSALSPVSGRVSALAVHPTNPNVVYAGGAQGGVWRTVDALSPSPTWTPLTDHQATLAIGDIVIDPVNPDIIYAGTGEPNGSCDSYYGQGILRSSDGGNTWVLFKGGTGGIPGNPGPFIGKTISKIVIDPATAGSTSGTTLWASVAGGAIASGTNQCVGVSGATTRGLWRSTDSGQTWSLQDVPTGGGGLNTIHDIALDPLDSNILYVAVRSQGVFKSTNARASSATFTRMGNGFAAAGTGANPGYARITLSIGGPSARNVLYAALGSATQSLWSLYKTTDGGSSWAVVRGPNNGTANVTNGSNVVTRVTGPSFTSAMIGRRIVVNNQFSRTVSGVTSPDSLTVSGGNFTATLAGTSWQVGAFPNYCDGQCFYDMTVGVDPQDPTGNTVYVGGNPRAFSGDTSGVPGGHSLWRSTDGGDTWRAVSQGDGISGGLHVDDHDVVFDTSVSPSRVYDGNDGGIWRSDDQGLSWTHMNTNIAITQFQGVALHPTDPNIVMGGTQDNGTNILNSALQPPPAWFHADFGDGGQSIIDQGTPTRMFHTYFNQAFNFMGPSKSTIGGTGGPGTWEFVGSYYGYGDFYYNGMDPTDPVSFYAPIGQHPAFTPNVSYFGSNKLYRSPDPQSPLLGVPSWTPVSPALTEGGTAFLGAIGVLPNLVAGNEVIYTGASDGRIAASNTVSGTGTPTWLVLTPNAGGPVIPNRAVTEIEVASDDLTGNTAYVTVSGFNVNTATTPGHVFRTINGLSGTATWQNLSGDLPDVPVNAIAIDYGPDPNHLYVGTDLGVFRSVDDGQHWVYLSAGHPVVSVFGLDRNAATGQLVSSTHGRGMFQLTGPPVSDTFPPTCGGSGGGNQWSGTAADDLGIASIVLQPGATNLVLSSVAYSGPRSAAFTVNTITSCAPGTGTVVVSDQADLTCSVPIRLGPPAAPAAASNTPVRAGTTLTLVASVVPGATTYNWTGPNGFTSTSRTPSITNVTLAAAGTYNVTVTVNGCTSAAASTVVTVVPSTNDFNFDGSQDIVWRHDTAGENVVWYMNGATLLGGSFTNPPTLVDANWKLVGTNDFNQDGKTDFLWRHGVSGEIVIWYMDGTTLLSGTFTTPSALADTNWKIAGTGLFNDDAKPDIAWRHAVSGEIVLWYMDDATLTGGTFTTPSSLDTAWQLVGVGNFGDSAKPDLLWRHSSTGDLVVWYMNDSVLVGSTPTTPPALADQNWNPSALGDYNNDGKVDIVWRHGVSGDNVIWFMDGVTLSSGSITTSLSDLNWKIVGPK